ncbi:MAG: fused response regulator/phosphatase [Balneola sp.]|nr:fused response regulator/phosphatase [Balneola sp.]MBE79027.1 fused response regulator/phosphatase [Balneola sp.]HBX64923.1 fused response regulator/phosphatase [Balneolaceae bacterium]
MRQHKIMVVDDEPDLQMLILQRFRKQIKEDVYDFCFAENGEEALDMLQESNDITLVLSDINMPKMDGLTFLAEAQKLNNPVLKTVIVSAYGDMENIRTAMNRGAFDFVTKPIDFKDLELTIKKGLSEIKYLLEAGEQMKTLESVQTDLETAARIQQKMLPQVFPPFPDRKEFSIYAEMHTAKQVGGDFYDFFMLDEHRLGFLIADVSGKGVPASIYMAVSRTMIRSLATQIDDPAQCLSTVNTILIPESDLTTFVTVFYGVMDTRTGTVKYCNGGHNLPYIVRKDGTIEEIENTSGLLLGKIEPIEFETKELTLQPGEKILMFTDGVTEAMAENEDMYEEPRLEAFLKKHSEDDLNKLVRSLIVDVLKFMGKADQSDDITVLSVGYNG